MAIRVLNDFRSLTEFGQYNGDCGFAATLPLLHCIDETAFPLTLAKLDELVTQAHANGFCEASGAINVVNLSRWLSWLPWVDHFGVHHKGVAHSTFCSYGSAAPDDTATWHPFVVEAFLPDGKTLDPGCFHAVLKAAAGTLGIVWERSAGAPLPGDELTVVYHYPGCGGVDSGPNNDGVGGAYLCCDGDNSADRADGTPVPAIRFTWAEIAASNPIGAIRINQAIVYNPGAGVPAPASKPAPVVVPVVVPATLPTPAPKVVSIVLTPDQIAAVKAS